MSTKAILGLFARATVAVGTGVAVALHSHRPLHLPRSQQRRYTPPPNRSKAPPRADAHTLALTRHTGMSRHTSVAKTSAECRPLRRFRPHGPRRMDATHNTQTVRLRSKEVRATRQMTSKFPGCLSLPNLIAFISRLDAALDPKKVAVAIHRLIGVISG